jgi:uracil DNA glycosylase
MNNIYSLRNIPKELDDNIYQNIKKEIHELITYPSSINQVFRVAPKDIRVVILGQDPYRDLTHLVDQGCFMLNTSLSVEKGCANILWYNYVIKYIISNCESIAWLLIGDNAQIFQPLIPDNVMHHVVLTSHSPFFSGVNSPEFLDINEFLYDCGNAEIEWLIC